jgi:hypothetical protein
MKNLKQEKQEKRPIGKKIFLRRQYRMNVL